MGRVVEFSRLAIEPDGDGVACAAITAGDTHEFAARYVYVEVTAQGVTTAPLL